jgi:uncharacterized protein YecT (DUF1311 family)
MGAQGYFFNSSQSPAKVTFNTSCERTAQDQVQLDDCAATELHALQGQLRSALNLQRRSSDPMLVDTAETAFKSYEKAECTEASALNVGGTIYPLIYSYCEINLTIQRIEQVRGDLLAISGDH